MTAYPCGRMKRPQVARRVCHLVVGSDMRRVLKWRRSNKGPHESRSFSLEKATGSYCIETGHMSSGILGGMSTVGLRKRGGSVMGETCLSHHGEHHYSISQNGPDALPKVSSSATPFFGIERERD